MPSFSLDDYLSIAPMLWVMILGMIVLMVDLRLPRDRKSPLVVISLGGLFLIVLMFYVWPLRLWGQGITGFGGTLVADDFALLFELILIVIVALSIALSEKYIQQKGINYGEYYALLLFSTSGAMLMACSRELITIFVGLEILSIALYVLSGFARTEPRSEESAMKYFLLGAFSSGFFLYGIALIYGGAGTTRLDLLLNVPITAAAGSPFALASPYTVTGFALLIVGLGFKAAIVPFHSWTPDVYEGAPTSVTAFMSAGAKAGAFAAFIRVAAALLPLSQTYPHVYGGFIDVLWILAILTMIVGNVFAVMQTNIKRMLAYSSIAHAGYILVGLLAQNPEGRAAVLFYIFAYTFMNLGAFGVLILLARRGDEPVTMDDLQGLAQRQPLAAGMMALFMLSLAGLPPTVGFIGKFFLFLAAVHAHLYALAALGLVVSVIGVFYYLRVIVRMFFLPSLKEQRVYPSDVWTFSMGASIALGVSAFFTLLLGIYSSGCYSIATQGANSLPATRISAPYVAKAPAPGPLPQPVLNANVP
jgi:NADH-quinone oxidoreductase subunit N